MKRRQKLAHTSLLKNLRSERKLLDLYVKNLWMNRSRIDAVAKVAARIDADFYAFSSRGKAYFTVRLNQLDGFKGEALINALEQIAAAVGDGKEWTSRDYPELSQREFKIDSSALTVELQANLSDAPANCQRVVKEVKHVEQFVYELRCDN